MNEGEYIKQRRKELGMSQEELGKKLGVTKAAISSVETGKERLTTDRLMRYAVALETTTQALQGLTVKPRSFDYYVEMLSYSLGYAPRQDADGNFWIETSTGGHYEITEEMWEDYTREMAHFAKYCLDRMKPPQK